ncbi:hypothetical protein [Vagococcus silagei]|uniref:Uncharacterized protein n=1 Tax=Vagococcus silagei TaxID=2508885 RepID=A0A4S3B506_9ENTE|nr:hypothetical protein [Vagococcus silagei]THB62171.1 hypothetical protein ESZ54_01120 [Vagococcus silagei]
MSLYIKQTTRLAADIKIENEVIVNLYADVSAENMDSTTVNQTIYNQDAYSKNKEQCRKQIKEFQEKVWKIEDQFVKDIAMEK